MKPTQTQIAGCVGKLTHESAAKAWREALKLQRRGKSATPYRCKVCHKWHIGRDGEAGKNA